MDKSKECFELLQGGNEDGLRKLLEEEPSAANSRDEGGVSLVMQALYRGRRSLAGYIAGKKTAMDIFEAAGLGDLERLKEPGHDQPNMRAFSADGFTALHFACYFGQPEAASLLLKNGADANAVARNPMQVTPLHSAASARNLEAARLLLEHGADVNARQHGGWAPLHAAAQNGDRAMVELLLKHGADNKLPNDQGQTPAMVAREKGNREIGALLDR